VTLGSIAASSFSCVWTTCSPGLPEAKQMNMVVVMVVIIDMSDKDLKSKSRTSKLDIW